MQLNCLGLGAGTVFQDDVVYDDVCFPQGHKQGGKQRGKCIKGGQGMRMGQSPMPPLALILAGDEGAKHVGLH